MCLALPGKLKVIETKMGQIDFQGVIRRVDLRLVPQAKVGDYVLVHAGFAIEVVDQAYAEEYWQYRREAYGRA